MRILSYLPTAVAALVAASLCLRAGGQDVMFSAPPAFGASAAPQQAYPGAVPGPAPFAAVAPPVADAAITPIPSVSSADAASIDGSQVIARIDFQIVQACEVLWHVNRILERNAGRVPPEQVPKLRQELIKYQLAELLDRKLLYAEFVRSVPPENLPHITEKLQEPFEQREIPMLMKQLEVSSPVEVEQRLTQLGSSMTDVRQAFNEKAIAGEWLRTKIKVSEEVSPDEMLEYYQAHAADYDQPTQVRWEELMVQKSRFASPAEAYAALAHMGNDVWQRAAAQTGFRGPAFVEVAKAKSHGYQAKENGGQHDWTPQGALKLQVIDQALFSLKVGQMSDILITDDAFYIVRVLERKEAGKKPFTDVQADIREKLKEERFDAAMEKYIGELRAKARIWTVFTGDITAEQLIALRPQQGGRR